MTDDVDAPAAAPTGPRHLAPGDVGLVQARDFTEVVDVTGIVLTKLDGTAKGGVLAAIALWSRTRETPLPVYFVGVGEKLADLQTFRAKEFAAALVG